LANVELQWVHSVNTVVKVAHSSASAGTQPRLQWVHSVNTVVKL
jgi:hypothetical protein